MDTLSWYGPFMSKPGFSVMRGFDIFLWCQPGQTSELTVDLRRHDPHEALYSIRLIGVWWFYDMPISNLSLVFSGSPCCVPWRLNDMGTLSLLLIDHCKRIPSVAGDFPYKRPVMWSLDVFFYVNWDTLMKFETPCHLWCTVKHPAFIKVGHGMWRFHGTPCNTLNLVVNGSNMCNNHNCGFITIDRLWRYTMHRKMRYLSRILPGYWVEKCGSQEGSERIKNNIPSGRTFISSWRLWCRQNETKFHDEKKSSRWDTKSSEWDKESSRRD